MISNKIENGIRIMNIEASDIVNYLERNRFLPLDHKGVLPYSLELIKLSSQKEFAILKNGNIFFTNDVINVKFNINQMNKDETKAYITKRKVMKSLKISADEYNLKNWAKYKEDLHKIKNKNGVSELDKLNKILVAIDNDTHEFNKRSAEALRTKLYKEGFKIKTFKKSKLKSEKGTFIRLINNQWIKMNYDGEIIEEEVAVVDEVTEYFMWKRSSSKSRIGECLFMKKELLNTMNNWAKMGLNVPTDRIIDLVGLSAYSSLVSSHIEKTIKIKPSNILLIDDVKSVFSKQANVVKKNEDTGHLDAFEEETEIVSDLFDGQSLLDKDYFEDGQSMMLLRQHFYKSASFSCDLQGFFQKWCNDNGKNYDTYKIKDMFGKEIRLKQIHYITTPNSLKALKALEWFDISNWTKEDMYNHWKKVVSEDDYSFGVCKHEKPSRHIDSTSGKSIQQMSYQMLNSLRLDINNLENEIKDLAQYEIDYINKLRTDINCFKKHLVKTRDDMNSNEMMINLLEKNAKFEYSDIFRDYRKRTIKNYKDKIKGGKIKISESDNLVIIGNPYCMLLHALGKLPVKNGIIDSDYEDETLTISNDYISCSTTMFGENENLVTFRNPHTSPSGIGICKNRNHTILSEYFNFSQNIIAVNLIKTDFQDRHSGADQDSDFIFCSNSPKLYEIVLRSYCKDLVCINRIPSKQNEYKFTSEDIAKMDNKLSQSKKDIGKVVNLGQLAMSAYYDLINRNKSVNKELEKVIAIMTILSGCCIDNAKRTYDINVNSITKDGNGNKIEIILGELDYIKSKKIINITRGNESNFKPRFWEYVSDENKEKTREKTTLTKCPMDLLGKILDVNTKPHSEDKSDEGTKLLRFYLIDDVKGKAKIQQIKEVQNQAEEYSKQLDDYMKQIDSCKDSDERQVIDDCYKKSMWSISKKTINEATMFKMLNRCAEIDSNKEENRKVAKFRLRLMNLLYKTHKETFMLMFK